MNLIESINDAYDYVCTHLCIWTDGISSKDLMIKETNLLSVNVYIYIYVDDQHIVIKT